MQIVTFADDLRGTMSKSSKTHMWECQGGRAYVFSQSQLQRVVQDHAHVVNVLRRSPLEPRLTQFNAKAYTSGSIMIYNGAGGYGDQILTMPFAFIMKQMGYEVHILTDPGNDLCWVGTESFVKSITILPCALSALSAASYHLMFETVTNHDQHPNQLHPVDSMLNRIGFDYASFKPEYKRYPVPVLENEVAEVARLTEGKKYAVYQLSAASPARSLTPDKSAFVLRNLATSFPDWEWYAVYDSLVHGTYLNAARQDMPANVFPIAFPEFRHLFALVKGAVMCVAPDSLVVHLAGSYGVPCVGLWGPTDPRLRVCYYNNHVALTKSSSCAVAPCLVHVGTLPPPFCPSLSRRVCACVDDIEVHEITDAVTQLYARTQGDRVQAVPQGTDPGPVRPQLQAEVPAP